MGTMLDPGGVSEEWCGAGSIRSGGGRASEALPTSPTLHPSATGAPGAPHLVVTGLMFGMQHSKETMQARQGGQLCRQAAGIARLAQQRAAAMGPSPGPRGQSRIACWPACRTLWRKFERLSSMWMRLAQTGAQAGLLCFIAA